MNLDPVRLADADYAGLIRDSLRALFPNVTSRRERRQLYSMVSDGAAYFLRDRVVADPSLVGQTVGVDVLARFG